MLEYKLKANGYVFVKIGRFEKSTQTCHECGYINKVTKDLKVKEYDCGGCGRHLYRDYNAALNIRDIGIRDISAEHFQKKQAKFSLADLRARKKGREPVLKSSRSDRTHFSAGLVPVVR